MAISELKTPNVPVKLWTPLEEVESQALTQLRNVASLPWAFHHVAVMADVHYGKGCTVGSVVAMKDAVSPAAVGVDIGCGMQVAKTNLDIDKVQRKIKEVRLAVEEAIPVGFNSHKELIIDNNTYRWGRMLKESNALLAEFCNLDSHVQNLFGKIRQQIGTLGGGNHFIELCLDTNNAVWLMLHSGSRNIGKELAEIHIAKARKLTHNRALPDPDLAVFLSGTPEMDAYRRDLYWAQRYAALNRDVMLQLYLEALKTFWPGLKHETPIACHHNYVAEEVHFGEQVFVTRKGAIRAGQDDRGIIPGCFAAGTRILMTNGMYKNIEDIKVGDKIVSGSGHPSIVLNTFNRGKRPVWRYRNNNFPVETLATPDHLHYVGNMSSANYQAEGRMAVLSRKTNAGLSKFEWRRLNDLPDSFTLLAPRQINFEDIPSKFEIYHEGTLLTPSYALGHTFGAFLGNGTSYYKPKDGGQVSWSYGFDRRSAADKAQNCAQTAFGLNVKRYAASSVLLNVIHSASLGRLFQTFGKEADKALPEQFWCSDPEYILGVYEGLIASDGHINNGTAKFTNTSQALIEQFIIIHFLLFKYFPSISFRAPSAGGLKGVKDEDCKPSFRATSVKKPLLIDEYQLIELLKLNNSSPEITEVFDIEVDNEGHSFVANNAIVHNSMGAKSFVVRGKGNPESYESASHGAGRKMSRGKAKAKYTRDDLIAQTKGIECRKDAGVIDEIPAAYKDIEKVMANQADLVTIEAELKQFMCVKG